MTSARRPSGGRARATASLPSTRVARTSSSGGGSGARIRSASSAVVSRSTHCMSSRNSTTVWRSPSRCRVSRSASNACVRRACGSATCAGARRVGDRRDAIEHRKQRRQQLRVARQQRLRVLRREIEPPVGELVDQVIDRLVRHVLAIEAAAAQDEALRMRGATRSRKPRDERGLAHAPTARARPRPTRRPRSSGASAASSSASSRSRPAKPPSREMLIDGLPTARSVADPEPAQERRAARAIRRVALEQLAAQLDRDRPARRAAKRDGRGAARSASRAARASASPRTAAGR